MNEGQMKKRLFWALLILIIICIVTSHIFMENYECAEDEFISACISFFMCIFFLFEAKNAYKPLRSGVINSVKSWYMAKGKTHRYKNICIGALVVFLISGIYFYVSGLVAII